MFSFLSNAFKETVKCQKVKPQHISIVGRSCSNSITTINFPQCVYLNIKNTTAFITNRLKLFNLNHIQTDWNRIIINNMIRGNSVQCIPRLLPVFSLSSNENNEFSVIIIIMKYFIEPYLNESDSTFGQLLNCRRQSLLTPDLIT